MFSVLSAVGEDAKSWSALIDALPAPLRDIHFLPDYGAIYGDCYGYEPLLACYRSDTGTIVQPFVVRPLNGLPFLAADASAKASVDIANPYGYGGPLSAVDDAALARRLYAGFAEEFAAWCDRRDIASEFASLHPFMAERQRAMIGERLAPKHEKDVVYIDLTQGEAQILKGLRKGHRSSAALARRAGARVERVDPDAARLAVFNEMYGATMDRRNAADRWRVPERYFEICLRRLGPGRASLFFAAVGGALESACLLLHAHGTAYYHFAATRAAHPELGVNNLMVLETALWAKSAGYFRYYLGGGVTSSPEDSLMRFKAGFSAQRAPLYTYFCVRDQVVYDHLCEKKRSHERATEGGESASTYLPLYRRQGAT